MKKIKNIGLILIGLAVMSSCNDSFMDRYPETNITEQVFFSSPEDLKTYTNGMYGIWMPIIQIHLLIITCI